MTESTACFAFRHFLPRNPLQIAEISHFRRLFPWGAKTRNSLFLFFLSLYDTHALYLSLLFALSRVGSPVQVRAIYPIIVVVHYNRAVWHCRHASSLIRRSYAVGGRPEQHAMSHFHFLGTFLGRAKEGDENRGIDLVKYLWPYFLSERSRSSFDQSGISSIFSCLSGTHARTTTKDDLLRSHFLTAPREKDDLLPSSTDTRTRREKRR